MRQAGIIAAPGIVALDSMINRLKEDHNNAKYLAKQLSSIPGISIDQGRVQTNIVMCNITSLKISDEKFIRELEKMKILALNLGKNKIRMVTHRGIEKEHIDKTVNAISNIQK